MAVLTQDDLLEAIDKMTVLELSEFIKRFEERYGVTAAAPAAVARGPAGQAGRWDAGAGGDPGRPVQRAAAQPGLRPGAARRTEADPDARGVTSTFTQPSHDDR